MSSEANKWFEIGDKVKIVDEDQVYVAYKDMAEFLGLENWSRGDVSTGSNYKVVGRSYHRSCGGIVYGIENTEGDQYLIDGRGLKKVVKTRWALYTVPSNNFPVQHPGDVERINTLRITYDEKPSGMILPVRATNFITEYEVESGKILSRKLL